MKVVDKKYEVEGGKTVEKLLSKIAEKYNVPVSSIKLIYTDGTDVSKHAKSTFSDLDKLSK